VGLSGSAPPGGGAAGGPEGPRGPGAPGGLAGPEATVIERFDDGVLLLTVSHPAARNALTRRMAHDLAAAVTRAADDPAVGAVVLSGAGDRAFSSGADLREMARDQQAGRAFAPVLPDLYRTLLQLRKPIVAALNGDAVGGGLELALACDVRVAGADVRLGLPEVGHGMVPRFGAVAAACLGSRAVALELSLTGDLVAADRAYELGLLNRVVARHEVRKVAVGLARTIAARPAATVAAIKQLLLDTALPPLVTDHPYVAPGLAGYDAPDRRSALARWAGATSTPTSPPTSNPTRPPAT
jgi:enoyl-CoA hydratase